MSEAGEGEDEETGIEDEEEEVEGAETEERTGRHMVR